MGFKSDYNSKNSYAYGHDILFSGEVYYANVGKTDDSLDGKTPETAKKNINSAIAIAAAGDAISVKAGTYVENVDLDKDGMEIWFEIGTLLQPVSGTPLTLSGDSCLIKGVHKIIAATTETGLLVSGNECHIRQGNVLYGAFGVVITGSGVMGLDYASGFQETVAYNFTGGRGRLLDCATVGSGSTIGYLVDGGADTGVIKNCTSVGHTLAGYYLDTGSQDWTVVDCSSGAGDGRWVDVDSANVWSNFTYDDEVFKSLTLDNSHAYNLFEVTGTIELIEISGHVETVLSGSNTDCYWQLYSSGGDDNITKTTDGNLGAATVETVIIKTEDAGKALVVLSATTPAVDKTADPKKKAAILTSDADQTTYIRWMCDGNDDTSGCIHFHVSWRPITDKGFLQAV